MFPVAHTRQPAYADAIALTALFVLPLLGLRFATDGLIAGNVVLARWLDRFGGALVGRHGPYSEEAAQEFAALVNGHDSASGPLWDAIRATGFEIIELPEALYGALTPDTR